ncbi:MAG: septum site-determining protein Ssd [Ornithinimicrobium sp.]
MNDQGVDAGAAGCVIGVLGASGGLGSSTLAAAMAVRGAMARDTSVLIDAHPCGGGLDIPLGVDGEPGLRWPDLSSVRGDIDAAAVLSRLPAVHGCAVLSWGRRPGAVLKGQGVEVAGAVLRSEHITVIDLPGAHAEGARAWWRLCDHIVILCGAGVRQIAAAAIAVDLVEAAVAGEGPGGSIGATVRGVVREQRNGSLDRDALSAILGLPFVGGMKHDPTVESALVKGEPIGGKAGSVALLCDQILAELLPAGRRVA